MPLLHMDPSTFGFFIVLQAIFSIFNLKLTLFSSIALSSVTVAAIRVTLPNDRLKVPFEVKLELGHLVAHCCWDSLLLYAK